MKLSKPLKISIFLIPVLVGGYLIWREFRRTTNAQPGNYVPPPTPQPTVTPVRTPTQVSSGCTYPLKQGVMNCDLVKKLQWALNNIPISQYTDTRYVGLYRPLAEDGDFGPKTQAVLDDFYGSGACTQCTIDNADELDSIISSYVVTDPVAFQAAENPYVQAPPAPEVTPQPTYFPKIF